MPFNCTMPMRVVTQLQSNCDARRITGQGAMHPNSALAPRADFTRGGDVVLQVTGYPELTAALFRVIPQEARRHAPEDGSWLICRAWAIPAIALFRDAAPDAPVYGPGESPEARERLRDVALALARRDAR